jgi:hypothetical protein
MTGGRGSIFRTQYKDNQGNGRINRKCSYYGIVKFN